MAWNIVIAGGGFGGLYAARRLERVLPRQGARLTIVTDSNFLLYTPLLPGAAAGTLEPRHVVVPLRDQLADTDVRLGEVTGADPDRQALHYTTADGRAIELSYDKLVVALGSVSRVLPIPGLAEHAFGFKTLADAIALRNRAVACLETAESIDDPDERRKWLTFVFVGAGYAGVEGVAELQDYVADLIRRYPRCRVDGTRWILVDAQQRIMSEIPARAAEFATRELQRRGIEIRTSTRLDRVDASSVTLSGGEEIASRTLCWTAGVRPAPVVARLGLPLAVDGRIAVDSSLRVDGRGDVWAIGDCAAVPDPAKHGAIACPPTAQHAVRQGRLAADNVAASVGHGGERPFRYKTRGVFVDLGRYKAVAAMMGLNVNGLPAWFAARTYHLALMPGTARRVRLVTDWTVGLLFGRDSSDLGQLGHPASLGSYLERDGSPDGTPAAAVAAAAPGNGAPPPPPRA